MVFHSKAIPNPAVGRSYIAWDEGDDDNLHLPYEGYEIKKMWYIIKSYCKITIDLCCNTDIIC